MARLTDVDVDFLSLVTKGANKQKIQIYKSDDTDNVNEPVKKDDNDFENFFNKIKSFFNKSYELDNKIKTFEERIEDVDLTGSVWDATDTLVDVFYDVIYAEHVENPEELLNDSIDEFAEYLKSKVNTSSIEKSIEFIKKEEGSDDVNQKEFLEKFKETVGKIEKRLDDIEAELKVEEEKEEVENELEKALKDTLNPIIERIEKIENYKGQSNQINPAMEEDVEKSENIFKGLDII